MFLKELVKKLKSAFPVKIYSNGDTLESLAHNAGQQKVIKYIENISNNSLDLRG